VESPGQAAPAGARPATARVPQGATVSLTLSMEGPYRRAVECLDGCRMSTSLVQSGQYSLPAAQAAVVEVPLI